jgi:delta14-sterol reductase
MSKHEIAKTNDVHALNPRTLHYEFLGPPGALLVSTLTPFIAFTFSFACSEKAGGCPSSYSTLPAQLLETVQDVEWWKAQWDPEGFAVYFGWYAFCILSWAILPGDWVEGLPTRTGQKIKYKINGVPVLSTNRVSLCLVALCSIFDLAPCIGNCWRTDLDSWSYLIHIYL